MIDIFGKKKIAKLESEIEELKKDLERLTRIYHNAKDEPSFKIVRERDVRDPYVAYFDVCALYLYVDKQEYKIVLNELKYADVCRDSARLTVNDNIAVFTIDVLVYGVFITYKFSIDYLQGNYVCEHKIKKPELNGKEVK